MSQDPPIPINGTKPMKIEKVPQFVMLTFDDAVTITNYKATYQRLFEIKNSGNKCNASATFFVSHDYTNYQLVNDLYMKGHEIASHTITHKSPEDYWKKADDEILMKEIVGQRDIISKFAEIPEEEIKGYRAPFLQTSGDVTFKFLKKNNFIYDSSMPTQSNSRPWPIYPYTLDKGFRSDCVVQPCPSLTPEKDLAGFFEIPLVDYWRRRLVTETPPTYSDVPCSMVDMCLPPPENVTDAEDYFFSNFERHYKTNKAPFPVFIHEAWLSQDEKDRKEGYFNFVKKVAKLPDVFFVTIQEVIEWLENPIPIEEYVKKSCKSPPTRPTKCPFELSQDKTHKFCAPVKGDDNTEHLIAVCGICPTRYPRYGHTSGDD